MYRYTKRTALWFKKLSAASEAKLLTGIRGRRGCPGRFRRRSEKTLGTQGEKVGMEAQPKRGVTGSTGPFVILDILRGLRPTGGGAPAGAGAEGTAGARRGAAVEASLIRIEDSGLWFRV